MTVPRRRLALIGGGGFAKEIAEVAQLNGHTIEATYSSHTSVQVGRYRGYLEELLADRNEFDGVALAVGGVNRAAITARAQIIAWIGLNHLPCPPLLSPHAILGAGVAIGEGTFIAHGVIVNADAQIGRFSVLNTAVIVGHDAEIGPNTTVSPGAFIGGRCRIGAGGLVGPLAKVLQGVRVGDRATIGMGCNVLRSLNDDTTVWPRPDIVAPASDGR